MPKQTKQTAQPKILSDVTLGQYFQLNAIKAARVLAFVYTCGYMLGYYIHTMNNRLAKVIR
jgi:hypothetical protein